MNRSNLRYYRIIISVAVVCVVTALTFNVVLDPLWYFDGNRLRDENYSFNERVSKTNRFLKKESQWDCVIFGSSRTTLLDESKIENFRCFNYSFSGGRAVDFLAFAEWLVARGFNPKRVIVGVDDFNYWESERNDKPFVPNFVTTMSEPPNFFQSYLTWDALDFSWRLYNRHELRPRYYSSDFIGTVVTHAPQYEPTISRVIPMQINPESRNRYFTLREKFPDAEFIVYVPLLSPWELIKKTESELQHYLDANYEIAKVSDAFYDFSIPSALTRDPSNTYDGEHYFPRANLPVIDAINGYPVSHGIRVDTQTKLDYQTRFVEALLQFKTDAILDTEKIARVNETNTG